MAEKKRGDEVLTGNVKGGRTKKDNLERCINCNQTMRAPYKGGGKMYCNRVCLDQYRNKNGYWQTWYQKKPEVIARQKKLCNVCKRNIKEVGERKQSNKYCSNRCMLIAQGIRDSGQTYVEVKMTLPQYRRYMKNA